VSEMTPTRRPAPLSCTITSPRYPRPVERADTKKPLTLAVAPRPRHGVVPLQTCPETLRGQTSLSPTTKSRLEAAPTGFFSALQAGESPRHGAFGATTLSPTAHEPPELWRSRRPKARPYSILSMLRPCDRVEETPLPHTTHSAAARPATQPVEKAACRLYPPVSPSISSTSPTR